MDHPVTLTSPKQVSARWRVNAFRKAWSAAAPGREGKRRLLAALPLWALTIGAAGAALAAEVMREALASNDRDMAVALARDQLYKIGLPEKSILGDYFQ